MTPPGQSDSELAHGASVTITFRATPGAAMLASLGLTTYDQLQEWVEENLPDALDRFACDEEVVVE